MADYDHQQQQQHHDLTSPPSQIPDYEPDMSVGINNNSTPENGGTSSTNGAGAGNGTPRPNSAETEMPQQVQEVLASDVQIPTKP